MLVISDTNILSSFAAGEALYLLFRLFPNTRIHIPPAAQDELRTGLVYGQQHLKAVLQAIDGDKLKVMHLSKEEQQLAQKLPKKLNAGECEAIALSKNRKGRLLSNDKRAVRYCRRNDIKVVDLPLLLRLLWTRDIISQEEVKALLEKMRDVENLQLSPHALAIIFAQN